MTVGRDRSDASWTGESSSSRPQAQDFNGAQPKKGSSSTVPGEAAQSRRLEDDRILSVAPQPQSFYRRIAKPALDRFFGAIFFLIALPVMVTVAVIVVIKLGRPFLFTQERIGKDGQPFEVYKFRTMLPDRRRAGANVVPFEGDERRRTHKSANDPRHTGFGSFLRRYSLDELPQLWNVLKGDMSIVGPRPELVHIVEDYEPWQHRRHDVAPGLTGLWQISKRQDHVPMHLATELDIEYVDTIGPMVDAKILVKTIPVLLGRQTGY